MIKVSDFNFAYPGVDENTIHNLNFEIQRGEIFGFLGPSGAGKSTTQKILIKLLKNYKGRAEVMGKDLAEWGSEYYNHIGVGFELPNHYLKLTAKENLQFFASFYDRPCQSPEQLLAMVGLEPDANKKVEGYSKGMKMRLNFIRSFMHDPEILFFDEPTSGLDPMNARIIKNIIRDLRDQGKTIFITTHSMQDADELCDRVAFIVDGKIPVIDSPRQLKLQNGQRLVRVEYGEKVRKEKEFALDDLGTNTSFLELLQRESIQTIHSEEATLEDVFIKVTGRKLT